MQEGLFSHVQSVQHLMNGIHSNASPISTKQEIKNAHKQQYTEEEEGTLKSWQKMISDLHIQ